MPKIALLRYLDIAEATALKERLSEASLSCTVRRQGPSLFVPARMVSYQVLVGRQDCGAASPIAQKFAGELKAKREEFELALTRECPLCKSADIFIKEKRNILQKIYYIGVTVRGCRECSGEWYT
jgi:hypothetical protein